MGANTQMYICHCELNCHAVKDVLLAGKSCKYHVRIQRMHIAMEAIERPLGTQTFSSSPLSKNTLFRGRSIKKVQFPLRASSRPSHGADWVMNFNLQ